MRRAAPHALLQSQQQQQPQQLKHAQRDRTSGDGMRHQSAEAPEEDTTAALLGADRAPGSVDPVCRRQPRSPSPLRRGSRRRPWPGGYCCCRRRCKQWQHQPILGRQHPAPHWPIERQEDWLRLAPSAVGTELDLNPNRHPHCLNPPPRPSSWSLRPFSSSSASVSRGRSGKTRSFARWYSAPSGRSSTSCMHPRHALQSRWRGEDHLSPQPTAECSGSTHPARLELWTDSSSCLQSSLRLSRTG
mmetsp:Transcript_13195/g.23575  ORF Transcript_13195/g.23575 Transcript_13195/m.23575 type:complete len:245 (+) Transcript_13195:471-1205(+)